jgi:cell division protein FtsB
MMNKPLTYDDIKGKALVNVQIALDSVFNSLNAQLEAEKAKNTQLTKENQALSLELAKYKPKEPIPECTPAKNSK